MKTLASFGFALLLASAVPAQERAPSAAAPARAPDAAAQLTPSTPGPSHAPSAPSATPPDRTPSAAGAQVYFITPKNGATLKSPLTVRFGLKGMGIAPAGMKFDNTGHHHLLVDTDFSELKPDAALPASDKILHFGKGQTETELKLAPGPHTLQIVFADYAHVPHDPPLTSKKITITVAP